MREAKHEAEGYGETTAGEHRLLHENETAHGLDLEGEGLSAALRTQRGAHRPATGARAAVASAGLRRRGFRLALQTVAASSVMPDELRLRHNEAVGEGEPARQRALAALAGAIGPQQRLSIVHAMQRDAWGRPCYHLRVEGLAEGASAEDAALSAERLRDEVVAAMGVGYPQFGFRAEEGTEGPDVEPPWAQRRGAGHWQHEVEAVPASLEVDETARGQAGFMAGPVRSGFIRLPLAPVAQPSFLDGVVPVLLAAPCEMQLRIEWTSCSLDGEQAQRLAELLDGLCHLDLARVRVRNSAARFAAPTPQDVASVHAWIRPWLAHAKGVKMRVRVLSAGRLPETLLKPLVAEVMQGRGFELQRTGVDRDGHCALDFSRCQPAHGPMPALFPGPASLGRIGLRKHYGEVRVRTPAEGTLYGTVSTAFEDVQVRLGPGDRAQHCYVVGGTGTGKSTLLLNLITQDMGAGHGVALLDPHGDLHREVLARATYWANVSASLHDTRNITFEPVLASTASRRVLGS